MTRKTARERLEILLEVDSLPTVAAQRARLRVLKVGWSTFVRWRTLYQEGGSFALHDQRPGRPRGEAAKRLDDHEERIARLESVIGRGPS